MTNTMQWLQSLKHELVLHLPHHSWLLDGCIKLQNKRQKEIRKGHSPHELYLQSPTLEDTRTPKTKYKKIIKSIFFKWHSINPPHLRVKHNHCWLWAEQKEAKMHACIFWQPLRCLTIWALALSWVFLSVLLIAAFFFLVYSYSSPPTPIPRLILPWALCHP